MWLSRRGAAGLLDEELYGGGFIAEAASDDRPQSSGFRTDKRATTDQSTCGQREQGPAAVLHPVDAVTSGPDL